MNDKSFWSRYIRWSDRNFSKRWYIILSIIFAPVFLFLERMSMKHIWEYFILTEIGENEEFCKWLDHNEFGLEKKLGLLTRIYKKDIVTEDDDKLGVYNTKELELIIYKEYHQAFIKKLEENFQFDIENFVSLLCDAYIQRAEDSNVLMRVYEISLVFYRYDRFIIAYRTMKTWMWVFALILVCLFVAFLATGYFRA